MHQIWKLGVDLFASKKRAKSLKWWEIANHANPKYRPPSWNFLMLTDNYHFDLFPHPFIQQIFIEHPLLCDKAFARGKGQSSKEYKLNHYLNKAKEKKIKKNITTPC